MAAKILLSGRLDLLQFIRPRNPEMPSWVPDWRLEERDIAPNDCRDFDNPFLAFDTLEPVIPRQCTENANVLEGTGCIVDTVCSFSDFETDETTSAMKALADMPSNKANNTEFIELERLYIHLEQIKQLCQGSAMTNPGLYGPHDTWFDEALWRIPIADQEHIDAYALEYQRATSESEQRYRSLIKTIQAYTSVGRRLADPDPRPLPAFFEEKVRPVISSEASSYFAVQTSHEKNSSSKTISDRERVCWTWSRGHAARRLGLHILRFSGTTLASTDTWWSAHLDRRCLCVWYHGWRIHANEARKRRFPDRLSYKHLKIKPYQWKSKLTTETSGKRPNRQSID